jgi:hypothetical protein
LRFEPADGSGRLNTDPILNADPTPMTYILALLAGVAGAAAGFFLGVGLGGLLVPVLGISSFEGGSGYFAVAIGLLGGLIGLIICIVVTLRYKGGYRTGPGILGRTILVLGGLAALVFVGIQVRLATLENFSGGNTNPQMQFEIRLPAGMGAPDRRKIDFEMQAGSQRSGGFLKDEWIRKDGDRLVLNALVPLYTRTSSRILVVSLPGQPKLLFSIGLAATPKVSDTFGAWQKVTYIDDGKPDSQPRHPNDAENFEIRYHVPEWRN